MTDGRNNNVKYSVLLVVYVLLNLLLLYYHEPWRDEAQVWLLSRDLPLWKLPQQMGYEGHPCLWHVIMYPFAHFGASYLMQNIIAIIFMTISVAILLYKSKFPIYLKFIIIFSPFFVYFYPVIARSYCMIPLFLGLLAYWYPVRFEHPFRYTFVIGLLVQSHVIMIMTAFSLSLCLFVEMSVRFYRERKKKNYIVGMSALLIPLGSAVFLLYEMMAVEKSSSLRIKTAGIGRTIEKILETTAEGMGSLCGIDGKKGLLIFAVGVLCLLFMLILKKTTVKYTVFTVLFMTFCFQFWLYAMAYGYSEQRLMTYPHLIIWAMWIMWTEKQSEITNKRSGIIGVELSHVLFGIFCILCLSHSLPEIKSSINTPYSNSKEVARFINANVSDDAVIITDNQAESSAIFPYLKERRDYIYAPNGQNFTFVTWDDHWMDRTDYDSFKSWFEKLDTGNKDVYMISCCAPFRSYIEGIELLSEDFELIYQTQEPSIKGEDYKIYRLR